MDDERPARPRRSDASEQSGRLSRAERLSARTKAKVCLITSPSFINIYLSYPSRSGSPQGIETGRVPCLKLKTTTTTMNDAPVEFDLAFLPSPVAFCNCFVCTSDCIRCFFYLLYIVATLIMMTIYDESVVTQYYAPGAINEFMNFLTSSFFQIELASRVAFKNQEVGLAK
jgi:hypothetical protein